MHGRTERRISSSPMMQYIRIPFVKEKYSEGCFVDNPARKKLKYEDIEHVMLKMSNELRISRDNIYYNPRQAHHVSF
jgi:hypothetical protein